MAVDLGAQRGGLQESESLEGPWHTLRRHDRDESLAQGRSSAEAWWAVVGGGGGSFRCFRVLQTGANADIRAWNASPNTLACAGIELYGALVQA